MSIKQELNNLHERDIWSLMLFVLFKVKDIPECSSLSELAYILDKKNMLKLCEYFGGQTIRIPTIDELETLTYSLLLYQHVVIEHMNYEDALLLIPSTANIKEIKNTYRKMNEVLSNYQFSSRSRVC